MDIIHCFVRRFKEYSRLSGDLVYYSELPALFVARNIVPVLCPYVDATLVILSLHLSCARSLRSQTPPPMTRGLEHCGAFVVIQPETLMSLTVRNPIFYTRWPPSTPAFTSTSPTMTTYPTDTFGLRFPPNEDVRSKVSVSGVWLIATAILQGFQVCAIQGVSGAGSGPTALTTSSRGRRFQSVNFRCSFHIQISLHCNGDRVTGRVGGCKSTGA